MRHNPQPQREPRSARDALLSSALDVFDTHGFDAATVSMIREPDGISNGSFFHFFESKEAIAATLYLDAIRAYHKSMQSAIEDAPPAKEGVARLVRSHIKWVVCSRRHAKMLFEQARASWIDHIREAQAAENASFEIAINTWRDPLVARGHLRRMPTSMFVSQIIGPAQIFCRAWLSGRTSESPNAQTRLLVECALRAVGITVDQRVRGS